MADGSDKRSVDVSSLFKGVLLSLVVGLVCIWTWCLMFPRYCIFVRCPECPDAVICSGAATCSEAAATIVLEDAHSGVWMVMDNDFVHIADDQRAKSPLDAVNTVCSGSPSSIERQCSWPPHTHGYAAQGVLFQMGPHDEDGAMVSAYDGVTISWQEGDNTAYEGGSVCEDGICRWRLPKTNFDWIDVNPFGAACTIDPLHAYKLFGPKPGTDTPVVPSACDVKDWGAAPDTCRRIRDLHAALRPDDAITFWAAAMDGYAVFPSRSTEDDVADGTPDGEDQRFVFDVYNDIGVDVWNRGCLVSSLAHVLEVRIEYRNPGSTHGGYHKPAMNG